MDRHMGGPGEGGALVVTTTVPGGDGGAAAEDVSPAPTAAPDASSAPDLRRCVFMNLHHPTYSPLAKLLAVGMGGVIFVSCLAYVLGTMERFEYALPTCTYPICVPSPTTLCTHVVCRPIPVPALQLVETITVAIFTFEYLLRMLTVHAVPQRLIYPQAFIDGKLDHVEPHGLRKTFTYSYQAMNVIDLLAILPYYLSFFHDVGEADFIFLRLLRLMRAMRIFKLGRYTAGGALLVQTLRASSSALGLLLFFCGVITLVFSSIIFYLEMGTLKVTPEFPDGAYMRPTSSGYGEERSPFRSIPITMYFVIIAATTVGFGDYYCTTPTGRTMVIALSYMGIIGIALPSTIVAKNFYDSFFRVLERRQEEQALLAKEREEGGNASGQSPALPSSSWFPCCASSGSSGDSACLPSWCCSWAGGGGSWQDFVWSRRNSVDRIVAVKQQELRRLEQQQEEEEAAAAAGGVDPSWQNMEGIGGGGGGGGGEMAKPTLTQLSLRTTSSGRGPSPSLGGGSGGGSMASAATGTLSPGRRRERREKELRRQQRMKALTQSVREQLAQIALLAERLGEMESATLALMQQLEELEE